MDVKFYISEIYSVLGAAVLISGAPAKLIVACLESLYYSSGGLVERTGLKEFIPYNALMASRPLFDNIEFLGFGFSKSILDCLFTVVNDL